MKEYQFKYKGITYECVGEDRAWQTVQFRFCIKERDWTTLDNRIINQLKFGPYIKIVDNTIIEKEEVTPTNFW